MMGGCDQILGVLVILEVKRFYMLTSFRCDSGVTSSDLDNVMSLEGTRFLQDGEDYWSRIDTGEELRKH